MINNIKSIGELLSYNFIIPSYQRGYRWGKEEVEDLLDDIQDFVDRTDKQDNDFYCLQPLEVVKDDNCYRVVDGQQRLTTIYLILKFLDEKKLKQKNDFISYPTKEDLNLNEILENIQNSNINPATADTFCITQSYSIIKNWFEKEKKEDKNFDKEKFKENLLNNTKVIWYELEDKTKEQESFENLNRGKIPLTSAELLKGALFLYLPTEDKKLLGTEWDNIEHTLQNKELWSFISDDCNEENKNHIELLFDIYLFLSYKDKKKYKNIDKNKENPWLYKEIYKELKDNDKDKLEGNYKNLWNKIKDYSRKIEDWFKNKELYHLIGYLRYISNNGIREVFEIIAEDRKSFEIIIKDNKNKEIYKKVKEYDKPPSKELEDEYRKLLNNNKRIEDLFKDKKLDHLIPFLRYISDNGIKKEFEISVKNNEVGANNDLKDIKIFEISVKDITLKYEIIKKIKEYLNNDFNKITEKLKNENKVISSINDLVYDDDNQREYLKKILILFNILVCIDTFDTYFPFYEFNKVEKNKNWSIEHIHAQHSEDLKYNEKIEKLKCDKEQLEMLLGQEKNEKQINSLIEKMKEGFSEENINYIMEESFNILGDNIKADMHKICNLALLDKDTNASFNNSPFYEKLQKMRERDNNNYIPLATKNTFLKYYSKDSKYNIIWSKQDREDYLKVLEEKLSPYLDLKKGDTNG